MSNNESIYEWIAKIIDTCNNEFHFQAVDKLISLYYEREKDEEKVLELEFKKARKWNEMHNIII